MVNTLSKERDTPICARVKVAKSIVISPDCDDFVCGYAVGDLDESVNNFSIRSRS